MRPCPTAFSQIATISGRLSYRDSWEEFIEITWPIKYTPVASKYRHRLPDRYRDDSWNVSRISMATRWIEPIDRVTFSLTMPPNSLCWRNPGNRYFYLMNRRTSSKRILVTPFLCGSLSHKRLFDSAGVKHAGHDTLEIHLKLILLKRRNEILKAYRWNLNAVMK